MLERRRLDDEVRYGDGPGNGEGDEVMPFTEGEVAFWAGFLCSTSLYITDMVMAVRLRGYRAAFKSTECACRALMGFTDPEGHALLVGRR